MPIFKELPLEQLACDPDQPRKEFGTESETNALKENIEAEGIEVPLAVLRLTENRYMILDGHRRYKCAQKLKLATAPCAIYENLEPAQIERKRYNIQNNRRPWRPMERSNQIARTKEVLGGNKSDAEIARYLGLSVSIVNCSLRQRNQKVEYIELMERHGLEQSYRDEFLKLRSKLLKIKDFEVDDIIRIIFEKIGKGKISSAKDLRKLKKIFDQDTINEAAIEKFLADPEMRISQLEANAAQTGFSHIVDNLVKKIGETLQNGLDFTPQERSVLSDFRVLLNKILG